MKNNIYNAIFFLAFFILFGFVGNAQKMERLMRSKININSDWNYLENDAKNKSEIINSKNWIAINLPHSWNSQDATDNEPGYRRSASWYKKSLDIPVIDVNKEYKLYFEGSSITSEVYVNGKEVGKHIGGYIGFTFDITKFIKAGRNEVLVRVDT